MADNELDRFERVLRTPRSVVDSGQPDVGSNPKYVGKRRERTKGLWLHMLGTLLLKITSTPFSCPDDRKWLPARMEKENGHSKDT
jgi:hypothetical protein